MLLAEQLAGIEGKVMLSINDVPEIREIFGGFRLQEVQTKYSVGQATRAKDVPELLVMNYDPSGS